MVDRLTMMENVLSGQLGSIGFWRSWFRRVPRDTVADAFELLQRVGIEEPTASLDPKTSRQVVRLLVELTAEMRRA